MIELSIDTLRDLLSDDSATTVSVRDAIRRVQSEITENKRQYPAETHLHSLEAEFAELINDHDRALAALEKSFKESDREPFLAIRLSSSHVSKGNIDRAKEILKMALDRRRSDYRLNYHYADLLRKHELAGTDDLIYYYRRGFTPGDSNYQAQFWFARYAYKSVEVKNQNLAHQIFDGLRNARLPHHSKIEIRDYDNTGDSLHKYEGVIKSKRSTFGFIKQDGSGYEIFFPINSVEDDLWEAMAEGDRVSFNIGYSYTGAVACHVGC